jgi:Na+/glutamate symporter
MKTILMITFLSIVAIGILFCAFAFYWLTFNFALWDQDARGLFAVLYIASICLTSIGVLAFNDLQK